MGMSRRQFTKEFKLAAVRRLEKGVSMGEVARGLEVNPNLLHHGRRKFWQGRQRVSRPGAKAVERGPDRPSRNGRSASQLWRSIF
jgi:transposase-like protein